MKFGIHFFPDVGPDEKAANAYFADALAISEEAERLGYHHIRTVEHYFTPYGGYMPNPLMFLAAVAARTKNVRLITGALLPVFNNPLKMAGEIAMLDAISNGRLDAGFARAFLPHEFRRFGIPTDESVARFREGLVQLDLLLTQERVSHDGQFHKIMDTTSLPRPTQLPRPKFYVASINTPESFEFAGRQGYSVMAIPLTGARVRELLGVYRKAWRDAGHPGNGEVLIAYHMLCHEDGATARKIAREPLHAYLKSLIDAASDWVDGESSKDYPGYDKVIGGLKKTTMESLIESGGAWIGSPSEIRATIEQVISEMGEFEFASLQVNFNTMPRDIATASMQLFAREVAPHFDKELAAA